MKFFILFVLATISSEVIALDSPEEVVRRFCQLDFNGHRLSSESYYKLQTLVGYQDEPGWDIVIGIKKFEIADTKIVNNTAIVTVKYTIDRSWPQRLDSISTFSKEEIKLTQLKGKWKISEYVDYPRVSAELLCKRFNQCNIKN